MAVNHEVTQLVRKCDGNLCTDNVGAIGGGGLFVSAGLGFQLRGHFLPLLCLASSLHSEPGHFPDRPGTAGLLNCAH